MDVQSPQSNGQVERLNIDLKAMLAKLAEDRVFKRKKGIGSKD